MKSIKDLENLAGKKVLVRVDYNVPMKDDKILDDFRIQKSLPTIEYLHKKGATVIILAHLGEDGKRSLAPVAARLKKFLPDLVFLDQPILSDKTEDAIGVLPKGSIVLLANVRSEEGEKKNAPSFARALSRYGEIFVNDAFSVSHRTHASIIGITKYLKGYAGLQMIKEIESLEKAFSPSHPFIFVLGGAKFDTKIPLVKKFLRSADTVFIGGALANDFFKVKGYEVGESLVDEGNFQIPALLKNKNLLLPIDVEVTSGGKKRICRSTEVKSDETIVDVGPETIKMLEGLVEKASFVLWNGPLGKYEDGFGAGTEKLVKIIARAKTDSVIGGGDTVSIISKLKLESSLGFVSTGGGATLDFLAKGTLAGIKVLK